MQVALSSIRFVLVFAFAVEQSLAFVKSALSDWLGFPIWLENCWNIFSSLCSVSLSCSRVRMRFCNLLISLTSTRRRLPEKYTFLIANANILKINEGIPPPFSVFFLFCFVFRIPLLNWKIMWWNLKIHNVHKCIHVKQYL